MARTVADQMVETIAASGVKRIYGLVGDSLNGFNRRLASPWLDPVATRPA